MPAIHWLPQWPKYSCGISSMLVQNSSSRLISQVRNQLNSLLHAGIGSHTDSELLKLFHMRKAFYRYQSLSYFQKLLTWLGTRLSCVLHLTSRMRCSATSKELSATARSWRRQRMCTETWSCRTHSRFSPCHPARFPPTVLVNFCTFHSCIFTTWFSDWILDCVYASYFTLRLQGKRCHFLSDAWHLTHPSWYQIHLAEN